MKNMFLTARDVATTMGIAKSSAYKIIRSMNDELKKEGYYTVSGKINREYF